MFGSLMTLASGVFTSAPSSARASSVRCPSGRTSRNAARMRPAREMSRVSSSTPAVPAYARTIGSREAVASMGASSVSV